MAAHMHDKSHVFSRDEASCDHVITYVLKAPRKSQAKAKCMQKCCSSETWPIGLLPALRASEEGAVCAAHLRCMDRSIRESGAAVTVASKQAVADGHSTTSACGNQKFSRRESSLSSLTLNCHSALLLSCTTTPNWLIALTHAGWVYTEELRCAGHR